MSTTVAMKNVTADASAAPALAEVTKSVACMENTLNNATVGSLKKETSAPRGNGRGMHGKSQGPKPWSSMTTAELAALVKDDANDADDCIIPTRRRAPPPKGATSTVTTYATSTTAQTVPNSPTMVQAPVLSQTAGRTAGNSPVNFYPPAPQVQQKKQRRVSQQQQQLQFPTQPVLPTFDESMGMQQPQRPATPPSMVQAPYNARQVSSDDESTSSTSYRHDPYAFNVLGDNQTIEARMPQQSRRRARAASANTSGMNASFFSEASGSVGYVNSAEVSPVKQQPTSAVYNEQRRAHVSIIATQPQWDSIAHTSSTTSPLMAHASSTCYSTAAASPAISVPSTPTLGNAAAKSSKVKRVYVNGRPIITPQ